MRLFQFITLCITLFIVGCSTIPSQTTKKMLTIDVSLSGIPKHIEGEYIGKNSWSWIVELESGAREQVFINEREGSLEVIQQQLLVVEQPVLRNESGILVVRKNGKEYRLDVNLLPDAKWVVNEDESKLLVLTDPSELYKHGILGDTLEASSVTMIDLDGEPKVLSKFSVDPDFVIEGLAPIWVDWNGDGNKEIVLTLSNSEIGAKIVLYDENGVLLAEGAAIGQGGRWRHMLAVASFGSQGEKELAEILTPHIGGVVGFYRWNEQDKSLQIVTQKIGYSTHDIGSTTMDTYAIADIDQNGQAELIVPTQSKNALSILSHQDNEIIERMMLPIDGRLSSNLEMVVSSDQSYALAAGRNDNILRIWTFFPNFFE